MLIVIQRGLNMRNKTFSRRNLENDPLQHAWRITKNSDYDTFE